MNARWEYRTIKMKAEGWFLGGKVDARELEDRMNTLGADGWELVTGFDTNQAYGASRYVVMAFKRRRGD